MPDIFPVIETGEEKSVADKLSDSDSDENLYSVQSQAMRKPGERENWIKYKFNKVQLKKLKYDATPFWQEAGKKLFPGLAMLYYRMATKHPSEAQVERFFSVAGFITSDRRARTGVPQTKAVTMRHVWDA